MLCREKPEWGPRQLERPIRPHPLHYGDSGSDQYQTVTTPKPPIPNALPPPCECEMLISRSRPTSVAKAEALAKSDSQLSERLTKCLNATFIVHLRIGPSGAGGTGAAERIGVLPAPFAAAPWL